MMVAVGILKKRVLLKKYRYFLRQRRRKYMTTGFERSPVFYESTASIQLVLPKYIEMGKISSK